MIFLFWTLAYFAVVIPLMLLVGKFLAFNDRGQREH